MKWFSSTKTFVNGSDVSHRKLLTDLKNAQFREELYDRWGNKEKGNDTVEKRSIKLESRG